MDFGDDSIDSIEVADSDDELPEGLNASDDESEQNNSNAEDADDYDSESSDISFVDQETREEAAVNNEILVLSKDKTIQYSTLPPPPARPPVVSFRHGKLFYVHNENFCTVVIVFLTHRTHSICQSANC